MTSHSRCAKDSALCDTKFCLLREHRVLADVLLNNFVAAAVFSVSYFLSVVEEFRSCLSKPEGSVCHFVRWPTTVTSKPNAHSKLQSAHIKFKSLTSNSNRSHQIQIAHSKFKSLTANYKSLTANSNRPQQIQIVHSKLKSLTANSNCSHQITNY